MREKHEMVKRMQAAIEQSNEKTQLLKQQMIEKHKQEEEEIIKYNQAKLYQETMRIEREQKLKEEKEREVQKLRDLQEKQADRQAEMDAVRAKRAYEQGERDARLREKLEVQKRADRIRELDESRKKQYQEKEKLLTAQAAEEKQQYLNIVAKNKQIDDHERFLDTMKK